MVSHIQNLQTKDKVQKMYLEIPLYDYDSYFDDFLKFSYN